MPTGVCRNCGHSRGMHGLEWDVCKIEECTCQDYGNGIGDNRG